MPAAPPPTLLLLWLAWLMQAALSALQVLWFGHQLGRPVRARFVAYQPRATIIVPVKGLDDNLSANVGALCRQDYNQYQLVFVVESRQDPACAQLEEMLARHDERSTRIIVAGVAPANVGQKVHNQLAALAVLDQECGDDEVWVFADTDIAPAPNWLALIVGPLQRGFKTGMTSSYRWLIPQRAEVRGGRVTIWSHLGSVINSSVACQLGRYALNHAWGGSMAVRVETARRGDLVGRLAGAVTDDYQFTRMCRSLRLRIAFVPQCLVASPVDFTGAALANFAHRQYLITRIYEPRLYLAALALTALYTAGWTTALFYLLSDAWPWPAAIMVLVFLLNQLRSTWRAGVIERAFGREVRQSLRATMWIDRWLTPLWMTLHLLVVLGAAMGRTMTWRGYRYRLRGRQRIERLD